MGFSLKKLFFSFNIVQFDIKQNKDFVIKSELHFIDICFVILKIQERVEDIILGHILRYRAHFSPAGLKGVFLKIA